MKLHASLRTITTSILSSLLLLAPTTVAAQGGTTPRLYFENTSVSATNGSNVSLSLHLDGQGTRVNAANIVVQYAGDQLQFVGLDKAGSFFDTFVPASPKAKDGKLSFAVASLGTATSEDVLVAHLIFTAKVASGNAKVSLTGSQTSNGGPALDTSTGEATVALSAGNGTASSLTITDIKVANVTTSTAIIKWHTDVPSSSTVDYGSNDTYGLSASAPGLTTDHSVRLADTFSGKTTVHFKVSSTSADNKSGVSSDQSFMTKGYTVTIILKDKQGKAYSGAKLRIGSSQTVTTDKSGTATVDNVAGGNQKVYVGDAAAQIISVKDVNGKAASDPQEFNLVAERSNGLGGTALLAILFVVLAAVLFWAWRKRRANVTVS